jgi:hypothetical protein
MTTLSQFHTLAFRNQPTDQPNDQDYIATCYIAGPMRGIAFFNFPYFEEATAALRSAGWRVFSPRENDLESGHPVSMTGAPEDAKPLKEYMVKDLAQVCQSDALFFLEGWENSKGAMLEHQVAQYLEIPCYTYETGGRIRILGSDPDGLLLGIDHDELELAAMLGENDEPVLSEPEPRLLGEEFVAPIPVGHPLYKGYPSAQEQIDRAKDQAIRESRARLEEDRDGWYQDWYQREKLAEAKSMFQAIAAAAPPFSINRTGKLRHPNSARFHEILTGLGELHDRKQRDYGAGDDPFANVRNSQGFGVDPWVGAMIRLNDKVKRLQSLQANGRLENESAEDSFRDIAVYAVIALVLFEEQYGRNNS